MTIPILFTFDASLLMPAGVCITSLLTNAAKDTFYDIFILHHPKEKLKDSDLDRLPAAFGNCRITYRSVENEFEGAYQVRGITETAYYRLIAPEIIPEYDKILYSDVDVIFREDLTKYYLTDIGDNYFGGVDNASALRPDVQEYKTKALGLSSKDGYFYSGNLIINCRQILKDNLTATFRNLGKNNYLQQDMDIINIACKNRIFSLSPAFCLTNFLYDLIVENREQMEKIYGSEPLDHALQYGIVHYNGAKPWNEVCLNMDLWWEYYRKSIFFDEKFARDFWYSQTYRLEKMSLWKRIKHVGRYFREGGKK